MARTLDDRQGEVVAQIKAVNDQIDAITRQASTQIAPLSNQLAEQNARLGLINELIAERDSAALPQQGQ